MIRNWTATTMEARARIKDLPGWIETYSFAVKIMWTIIGIPSNFLAMIILTQSKQRRSNSVLIILFILAVNIFNIGINCFHQMTIRRLVLVHSSDIGCGIYLAIYYTVQLMHVTYLLMANVWELFNVRFPLRSRALTFSRTRLTCIVIIVLCFAINSAHIHFWGYHQRHDLCYLSNRENYEIFSFGIIILNILLTIILFIINCSICVSCYQHKQYRRFSARKFVFPTSFINSLAITIYYLSVFIPSNIIYLTVNFGYPQSDKPSQESITIMALKIVFDGTFTFSYFALTFLLLYLTSTLFRIDTKTFFKSVNDKIHNLTRT